MMLPGVVRTWYLRMCLVLVSEELDRTPLGEGLVDVVDDAVHVRAAGDRHLGRLHSSGRSERREGDHGRSVGDLRDQLSSQPDRFVAIDLAGGDACPVDCHLNHLPHWRCCHLVLLLGEKRVHTAVKVQG